MSTKKSKTRHGHKQKSQHHASLDINKTADSARETIDRAAIHQTVVDLPRLMAEEGYFQSNTADKSHSEKSREPMRADAPKVRDTRRVWLWTGVTLTTLVIFTIWIFNLRIMVTDMKIIPSAEDELLKTTKTDLDAALNFIKNKDMNLETAIQPKPSQAEQTQGKVQALLQALFVTPSTTKIDSQSTKL